MRYLLTFGYWTLAVLLLAGLTVSFGYGFDEALFIASSMLPGMFCAKLLLPAALRTPQRRAVAVLCVAVGTLVVEWLSLLLVHRCSQLGHWQNPLPFPSLFSNPAFLILLLAAIVVPEMLFARWIDARLPRMKRVTFVSERRKVTLAVADILYVESCDSEVLVHTVGAAYSATEPAYRSGSRCSTSASCAFIAPIWSMWSMSATCIRGGSPSGAARWRSPANTASASPLERQPEPEAGVDA